MYWRGRGERGEGIGGEREESYFDMYPKCAVSIYEDRSILQIFFDLYRGGSIERRRRGRKEGIGESEGRGGESHMNVYQRCVPSLSMKIDPSSRSCSRCIEEGGEKGRKRGGARGERGEGRGERGEGRGEVIL